MPVSIETRPELDLTIFTATGAVSVGEQKQVMKSFYEGTPSRNVIWDFTQMEGAPASSSDLRDIIQYAKRFSDKRSGGCTALVVDTKLKYGLARMASTFAEIEGIPWAMEVFENLDAALARIAQCRQAEKGRS
jgi:hypothetical protein